MKILLITLMLFTNFASFAETPEVWSRNVTCQELKDTLANYGSVKVKWKFLGLRNSQIIYEKVECRAREMEANGVFSTKDIRNCRVGKYCEPEIIRIPCHNTLCSEI